MKTAYEYLKEKGINQNEPIFWYSGTEYLTLADAMNEFASIYANQKLDEAADRADIIDDAVDRKTILSFKDKI